MNRRRSRFTSAHAISLVALFVALGGTVYAATKLDGRVIKKGSIPANRLKADSITGAQVNEGALDTVPSATTAAEATQAVEAGRATEAARAVEAARATEATEATQADSAARASRADQADNALMLGNASPDKYQRACSAGTIKGVARVVEEGANNPRLITAYNCSGLSIAVERQAVGQYRVNFEGLDSLLSALVSDIAMSTEVDVAGLGGGAFLVTTATAGGGRVDNDQFTLVVF